MGHNRALLKQKQMMNDIEMMQIKVLSDQQHDDAAIRKIKKMRDENEKELENQRHHDEILAELKEVLDSLNPESDIDFEDNIRLVSQEHNKSLEHQLQLMMQIEEMKSMYNFDVTEKKEAEQNAAFKEKVSAFEKSHQENMEKQKDLITEIKKIQENIVQETNEDVIKKFQTIQNQSEKECEHQNDIQQSVIALKDMLDDSTTNEDTVFEEKIRELHQEHNRNLQHQIEMMAQIDEMKKIYELETLEMESEKSDERAMKNLESIKKDHNRALLKQKQMINEIEMMQMKVLSDQQHDDAAIKKIEEMRAENEQELKNQRHHDEKLTELKEVLDSLNPEDNIVFEEDIRLVSQEHNRSLEHQLQLMMQIEEMKSMYNFDFTEKKEAQQNAAFKEKLNAFEKSHQENMEKQKDLITEIK